MNVAKDIVDKYTTEQIIKHLDGVMAGILMNYRASIKANQPQVLYGSLGDISQVREILHEMHKRNEEHNALKENVVK